MAVFPPLAKRLRVVAGYLADHSYRIPLALWPSVRSVSTRIPGRFAGAPGKPGYFILAIGERNIQLSAGALAAMGVGCLTAISHLTEMIAPEDVKLQALPPDGSDADTSALGLILLARSLDAADGGNTVYIDLLSEDPEAFLALVSEMHLNPAGLALLVTALTDEKGGLRELATPAVVAAFIGLRDGAGVDLATCGIDSFPELADLIGGFDRQQGKPRHTSEVKADEVDRQGEARAVFDLYNERSALGSLMAAHHRDQAFDRLVSTLGWKQLNALMDLFELRRVNSDEFDRQMSRQALIRGVTS